MAKQFKKKLFRKQNNPERFTGRFDSAHRNTHHNIMKQILSNGIEWVSPDGEEIEKTPFQWGNDAIIPGFVFDQIGRKKRTSIAINGCKLEYCGRCGARLLFSVNDADFESKSKDWYLSLSFVNCKTLLGQSSPIGFFDIRF